MTKQIIEQYYNNLYKNHPKLANQKNEAQIRAFIEKYFKPKN